ncbi:peptide ABC transporter substrate-binding protein [Desulfosporosinus sp. PR]|uniref:peptide ABC transporter substrate-binding protein n=1 Tax=Candidatus Desulfosporosinus nitrosoreducens TaxID=3401928 RepID=UPI0027FBD9B2|nr:peptide ABC transporter substrate-binding protein [Desulfosporosinus sp. PR]MDQ7093960.1 peptide ABC transporter substrate-binding protein [Desulfosporosinus sp. PR]
MRKNRGIAAVIAITLMLGLVLTGCGSAGNSSGGGTSAAKEMKMSFAPGGEPKTLDPQMSNGVPEAIMEMALFEGIMRLDKDNVPQLAVADSVEVSPDGLKYTVKLKDSKFSNGDPLTASDFKASWLHALDPAAAAEYAYQLFYIKNAEAYNSKKAKAEDVGINVVDPKTLEITLEAPCPYFKSLLAFPTYFPVDQKNVKANGNWNTEAATFVSNGPFMMKSWSHNDKMVLVKNPNYYDVANVKLSELDFNLVEDGKAATTAFEAGQLDGHDNLVPEDIVRFKKDGTLKQAPQLGTYFYRFNTTRKPLNDPRVRQALTIALNRQDLIDNVFKGGQTPAFAYVPGAIPDATPGKDFRSVGGDFFKEDVAKAKQLLAEAGYPDGKNFPTLTILYNTNGTHQLPAQAIQDYWQKNLGITVKLQGQEWAVYQQSMQGLQYDIVRAGWLGDYIDPMTFLDMFVTNGGNNQTGWSNAAYDKDIDTAKNSADQTVRMQAMHDAEKILMTEMPIMPIYFYVNNYVLKDNIKGVLVLPQGFFDFKNATVQ